MVGAWWVHGVYGGDAHVFMRFVYRIEIIDALKPIVHLFELPCLPLTDLVPNLFPTLVPEIPNSLTAQ